MEKEISAKEKRIRNITHLYYSRQDVQDAIFEFSKNREISPRYFEGFGKRPDSFQYKGDIFELVKRGATSFHCSEELWQNPLNIETGMSAPELNKLRVGWDLLIDIDCKWFDYSKLAAQAIIKTFEENGIKNIGLKFSGSKGFHILVPWKAFPKELAGEETKNLFPELPRTLIAYLRYESEKNMKKSLPEDFYKQFKKVEIKKGIKCLQCNEIANAYKTVEFFCNTCGRGETKRLSKDLEKKPMCPECRREFDIKSSSTVYECSKCQISSKDRPDNFSQTYEIDLFELMGLDIVLVSPRHLFRMPYSLHEKTALASVVIDKESLENFEPKYADPMTAKINNFSPNAEEGEAKEFVLRALDWARENKIKQGDIDEKITGKYAEYKPIKLTNLTEENFPPCILKILEGVRDGKKRSLFVLLHLFRSIGMDKEELEKRLYEWNQKNEVPLKEGYIKSQLLWAYRRKPILPQNCREFYQGLGVCVPDQMCATIKNPLNYVVKKNFIANKKKSTKKRS